MVAINSEAFCPSCAAAFPADKVTSANLFQKQKVEVDIDLLACFIAASKRLRGDFARNGMCVCNEVDGNLI
jgi:hypothetical protein